MTSFTVLRNLISIALTACCVIGVADARARTYILTDLGVIPGQKPDTVVTPAAINDKAQVAGTSGPSAFRYTRAKAEIENAGGDPAGTISRGFGINSSGQVVGDSTFGKNEASHAALFSNGVTTDLATPTQRGIFSRANGINASGQVVGFSGDTRDGSNSRAFILNTAYRSRMIDLGTLLGGAYAQAFGINDSGSVTGNAEIQIGPGAATSHAFIWHVTTGMRDLKTLGGDFSHGTSINANNHVAGYSTINNLDGRIHAFLYRDEMLDLGSLSGASVDTDFSFALGVNAADHVVGYSYLPSDNGKDSINVPLGPWPVAFIYSDGLMVNLNDLIGPASKNYRLDSATAINDNGEIVAVAFDTKADVFHAVLLTPDSDGRVEQ